MEEGPQVSPLPLPHSGAEHPQWPDPHQHRPPCPQPVGPQQPCPESARPPGDSQGHSSRANATAQDTGPCSRRLVNNRHRAAPTPPAPVGTGPLVPGPGARGGRPNPAASSAPSPGARPGHCLPPGPVPGEGTLCRKLGAGGGSRRPSVLTQSRGLSQRGWRRRGRRFYLCGRGPPIDGAGAVHGAPAVRQCGTGGRGRAARTQADGARGPAGARGRAGDGDAGGGCGEGAATKAQRRDARGGSARGRGRARRGERGAGRSGREGGRGRDGGGGQMRQRPGRQAQAHAESEAEAEQDTANIKGGPQGRGPRARGGRGQEGRDAGRRGAGQAREWKPEAGGLGTLSQIDLALCAAGACSQASSGYKAGDPPEGTWNSACCQDP